MTLDIYYYGFYNEILLRFRPSSLSRALRDRDRSLVCSRDDAHSRSPSVVPRLMYAEGIIIPLALSC